MEKTKPSALNLMAARLSVDPVKLLDTLKATVFQKATNEELLALVVVSNEYGLNPLLREIFAFPGKSGGIVPMVPIDGWTKIVNRQENYDGLEFAWEFDDEKKPVSCTCTIYVKGRSKPVVATEFFEECFRNTEPWKGMPRRMLRHKAFMQTARLAFGFSGIYDPDEAKDIIEVGSTVMPAEPLKVIGAGEAKTESIEEEANRHDRERREKEKDGKTPQAELESLCVTNGHTFDALQKWGLESGNIEGADSMAGFADVPNDVCKRLLRAQAGLLKGLEQVKK